MSETALSVDVASSASKKVQLSSISVTCINAGLIGRERRAGELTYREKRTSVEWSCSGDALNLYLAYKGEIEVLVRGEVESSDDEETVGEPLGTIQLDLHSRYELLEAASSQELYHFAGIVGFMHAYPYIRAEVQMLTSKLGLPPLTLGVLLSGQAVNRVAVTPQPAGNPDDHGDPPGSQGRGQDARKRNKRPSKNLPPKKG